MRARSAIPTALLGAGLLAAGGGSANETTRVDRVDVRGRGTAELSLILRERDACLRIVRRWDGGREADRWRSCGFPLERVRLDVHTRIACKPGEMHYLGVAPRRTRRFVAWTTHGRRKVRARSARRSGYRAKLFMLVLDRGELYRVRAVDARGRKVAATHVNLIRGAQCGHPSPRDGVPLEPGGCYGCESTNSRASSMFWNWT